MKYLGFPAKFRSNLESGQQVVPNPKLSTFKEHFDKIHLLWLQLIIKQVYTCWCRVLTIDIHQLVMCFSLILHAVLKNRHRISHCTGSNLSFETDFLFPIFHLASSTTQQQWHVLPRSTYFADHVFLNSYFTDTQFKIACRMSCKSFDILHLLLRPSIEKQTTHLCKTIPSNLRLTIFLYHIALGASYLALSLQFGISKSTVSSIIVDVA